MLLVFAGFRHALRLLIYIKIVFIFNSVQKQLEGKNNRDKSFVYRRKKMVIN